MATKVTIESDKLPPKGHPRERALKRELRIQIGTIMDDAMIEEIVFVKKKG